MAKPDSGACEPAATPGRTPRTTTRAGFGRTAQQAGRQPAPGRQATQARPPGTAASWGQCSLACAREPLSQGNPGRLGGGGMALILPGTPACQPCTAGPGRAFSADGRARPNPALAGRCERELMHDNAKASYDKLPNPGHRPRRTGLGQLMSPRRERPGDGTDRVRIGAEEPARWPDIAWGCQLRPQGAHCERFRCPRLCDPAPRSADGEGVLSDAIQVCGRAQSALTSRRRSSGCWAGWRWAGFALSSGR
jgi:hypothetical protein